jgi:hypothetical protein
LVKLEAGYDGFLTEMVSLATAKSTVGDRFLLRSFILTASTTCNMSSKHDQKAAAMHDFPECMLRWEGDRSSKPKVPEAPSPSPRETLLHPAPHEDPWPVIDAASWPPRKRSSYTKWHAATLGSTTRYEGNHGASGQYARRGSEDGSGAFDIGGGGQPGRSRQSRPGDVPLRGKGSGHH